MKIVAFTHVLLIFAMVKFITMDIGNLIAVFERKLAIQRYSVNSTKNYCSAVRSFLQVAEKRFDQPDELGEKEIEKYVYWKIRKDHISSSYQCMIVASIDKFYNSVVGKNLNIRHLYPSRKNMNCQNT